MKERIISRYITASNKTHSKIFPQSTYNNFKILIDPPLPSNYTYAELGLLRLIIYGVNPGNTGQGIDALIPPTQSGVSGQQSNAPAAAAASLVQTTSVGLGEPVLTQLNLGSGPGPGPGAGPGPGPGPGPGHSPARPAAAVPDTVTVVAAGAVAAASSPAGGGGRQSLGGSSKIPVLKRTNYLVVSPLKDPIAFPSGQYNSMEELYEVVKLSLGRNTENALKRFARAAITDQQNVKRVTPSVASKSYRVIEVPEPRNEVVISSGDVLIFPVRMYTSASDLFMQVRLGSPSFEAGFVALRDLQTVVQKDFPSIELLLPEFKKAQPIKRIRRNWNLNPLELLTPQQKKINNPLEINFPAVLPVTCNIIGASQSYNSGYAPILRTVSCGEGKFQNGGWHFNFQSIEYHPIVRSDLSWFQITLDSNDFKGRKLFGDMVLTTLVVIHMRATYKSTERSAIPSLEIPSSWGKVRRRRQHNGGRIAYLWTTL